jgi:uncharacterized protein (DUF924 family)
MAKNNNQSKKKKTNKKFTLKIKNAIYHICLVLAQRWKNEKCLYLASFMLLKNFQRNCINMENNYG